MTRAEFNAELARLVAKRNASLRRLHRQGTPLDDLAAATGFSRRLVAAVCCRRRTLTPPKEPSL